MSQAFRGQPLTWESSDAIFYGNLGPSQPWSWKVRGMRHAGGFMHR